MRPLQWQSQQPIRGQRPKDPRPCGTAGFAPKWCPHVTTWPRPHASGFSAGTPDPSSQCVASSTQHPLSGKELSHNEGGWGSANGLKMAGSGRRADLLHPRRPPTSYVEIQGAGSKGSDTAPRNGPPRWADVPCCGPPTRRPFSLPFFYRSRELWFYFLSPIPPSPSPSTSCAIIQAKRRNIGSF